MCFTPDTPSKASKTQVFKSFIYPIIWTLAQRLDQQMLQNCVWFSPFDLSTSEQYFTSWKKWSLRSQGSPHLYCFQDCTAPSLNSGVASICFTSLSIPRKTIPVNSISFEDLCPFLSLIFIEIPEKVEGSLFQDSLSLSLSLSDKLSSSFQRK